jgi:hypothetical protein
MAPVQARAIGEQKLALLGGQRRIVAHHRLRQRQCVAEDVRKTARQFGHGGIVRKGW